MSRWRRLSVWTRGTQLLVSWVAQLAAYGGTLGWQLKKPSSRPRGSHGRVFYTLVSGFLPTMGD